MAAPPNLRCPGPRRRWQDVFAISLAAEDVARAARLPEASRATASCRPRRNIARGVKSRGDGGKNVPKGASVKGPGEETPPLRAENTGARSKRCVEEGC